MSTLKKIEKVIAKYFQGNYRRPEIFRGKPIDNIHGDFIVGHPLIVQKHYFIISIDKNKKIKSKMGIEDMISEEVLDCTQIIPFTLTQKTNYKSSGRKDTDVFEGDILAYGDNLPCIVYWDNYSSSWQLYEIYPVGENDRTHEMRYSTGKLKKIGNIFDNIDIIKQDIDKYILE